VIETERLAEYNDPLQLYFLDGQQGWLLTGHGAAAGSAPVSLYQTQDGGQTWQLRLEMLSPESGSVNTCCTSGMVFLDSNTGLITKSAGPDPIGQVNWSKDGGGTWFRQDIPVPAEYSNPAYCGTASPGVVSPDLTYFLGECLPADDPNGDLIDLLYTTHDLGATWDITILPASPEPSPPLALDYQSKQIHFVDGQTGWFVISNIYAGEAGAAKSGQTLIYSLPQVDSASIPLGQFDWAGQVYFLDQKLGWATIASDAPGGLAFTQDGGLTWEFISPTLID
jgi:hypothetical protein